MLDSLRWIFSTRGKWEMEIEIIRGGEIVAGCGDFLKRYKKKRKKREKKKKCWMG